jgi:hypothetical protein
MPFARAGVTNPARPAVRRRPNKPKDERQIQTYRDFPPQTQKVLQHLLAEGSITNCEAHTVLRARSVSRRITTLRRAGVVITKERRQDITGQRYTRYQLVFCPTDLMPPTHLIPGGTGGMGRA